MRGCSDRSNPINQAGGPGSGEDSSEAGSTSQEGTPRKRARFRPRIGLPRPRLPRLRRRTRDAPEGPVAGPPPERLKAEPPPERPAAEPPPDRPGRPTFEPPADRPERPTFEPPAPGKRAGDFWFRLVRRLRAIGDWLREKGGAAWRRLARAGAVVGHWWSRSSRGTKIRILAAAAVVVLYLIVRFASVPGVPCEISAPKECAPSNQTASFVPSNSALYVHLTVNSDSHQWELAEDFGDELPNFTTLLRSDTSTLATPAARPIDLPREVLPWAQDDITLVGVPGPKKSLAEAYLVGVGDEGEANRFLASLSPGAESNHLEVDGTTLTVYSNGLATGFSGDVALFGEVLAVRAALDTHGDRFPELTGTDQGSPLDSLPDLRLAELYLSRAGVQRLLVGKQGGASQLDTFVDYGATTGMAAALRLRDDGVEVHLASRLDPELEQRSPTVFAALPQFEPDLADQVGSRALGYIGVGDLGPALSKALATAGAGAQGLAGSLRRLAQRLQREAGVDPLRDLLPALGGQAALVAEPTDAAPYASLIVDGVDENMASAALAALQRPVLRAVAAGQRVPSFQTEEVDGVEVHTVQVSPSVDLSYAVFDGKLVISTQPDGIEQVRSGGESLAGSGAYEDAVDRLPDRVSALVFLNLDEVFGLAQQAGLATDPLYASLSEDISRVGSLGLAVRGSEGEVRSELFLAIHH
jgi:Protein of unknown function (DUF3352)